MCLSRKHLCAKLKNNKEAENNWAVCFEHLQAIVIICHLFVWSLGGNTAALLGYGKVIPSYRGIIDVLDKLSSIYYSRISRSYTPEILSPAGSWVNAAIFICNWQTVRLTENQRRWNYWHTNTHTHRRTRLLLV